MKTNYDEKQIYVRKWQNEDAGALLELGRDRKMKPYWKHSYPYTQRKAHDCIQFLLHANPLRYASYAILFDNQLYGWIQAKCVAHQCAELTYWLKDENPKEAVLTTILNQMIFLSFTHLDILTLYMKTVKEETALRSALLQLGFIENNETVPIYLYFLHMSTPFTFTPSHNDILHS